jgi:hypothetical protein
MLLMFSTLLSFSLSWSLHFGFSILGGLFFLFGFQTFASYISGYFTCWLVFLYFGLTSVFPVPSNLWVGCEYVCFNFSIFPICDSLGLYHNEKRLLNWHQFKSGILWIILNFNCIWLTNTISLHSHCNSTQHLSGLVSYHTGNELTRHKIYFLWLT